MYIYILYSIQIITNLILLFFLIKKSKENKLLWWLFIFNISIILWVVFSALILVNYNQDYVIYFVRTTYAITSISLLSFVIFIRKNFNQKFDLISILVIVSSVFMSLLSFTNLIIKDVVITEYSSFVPVVFGKYSFLFIINFAFAIIVLLSSIFKNRKNLQGLDSLRLRYVTTSMILAGVVALLTNVIIPAFIKTSQSAVLGPIAMGIVSALTTYSYINNRLFSISFLVRKLIYYISLILFPLFLIYISTFLQRYFQLEDSSPDFITLSILISIIFVLAFLSSQKIINKGIASSMTSTKLTLESERDKFTKIISTKLDLNQLGITTLSMLFKSFNVKQGGIVIFNKNNASVLYRILKSFNQNEFNTRDLLQVIYYWDEIKHSTILVKNELTETTIENDRLKRIFHFMKENGIEIILPLNRKVQLNGVVLLGSKSDSSSYTAEEISFLESVIINSSIAFGRAILHQEVEDLNKSLQNKVDIQTNELKIKVKQLEEARQKENDMIDIMGHELRTPATIVKLNVDFLHKFSDKLPTDRESFLKYISRIRDAIDTEIMLINTLLTSAKLSGDKIELNPEKVDVYKQVDMALHSEEETAKKKGVDLINYIEKDNAYVYADHARVAEILYNLISNAVRYTDKGSVTVSSSTEGNFVKTTIRDTGRGISKNDIPKLGTKFFRTKTYIESKDGDDFNIVRPGGTGLGLYVTFGLVRKMGGRIDVQSKVGQGSTFTVSLPKFDSNAHGKTEDNGKDMFKRLGLHK